MTQAFEILVLDDEHDAADMMFSLLTLELQGAVVRVVYTGEDAVAAGTEHRPDAAIFDLEMIGLGGEGAARALRSAYPDSQLLLIALSGNVLRLAALRETGTFDYLLSKPLDVAMVIGLLKGQVRAA
ncbi:response regulator [Variovorax sp. RT4R15]|uniref:response regulator n=1 Tax=Variovorax sp. RT4R15 TaxID=3443737 RepID=UPI003F44AC97